LFLPLILFFCIRTNAQTDTTTVFAADTSIGFFAKKEKIDPADWKKISLVTRARKTISLYTYLNDDQKMYPEHALADMDGDGKKELVISIFTGGAHCCDEISIFRNTAPNKYTQTGRLYAGHSMITSAHEILYTFYEHFGYFFSCYACGIADTSDTAPIDIKTITLNYIKGKLRVKQGDQELRSVVNDNLGKLSEMPFEELDKEMQMDNGLRKEFAMNLAVYYFSFGKNLTDTRAMFNRYYKFPDAGMVWTAFTKQLRQLQASSDL
jgi:hypothetical protein